ncbi:MAG TPA: MYXO-CTERM sorting domain-containing protein, partial [Kofleriaceae bacterium]|nr:MYXO-CTERM sorting domain-containing protein [Kofleriaceae bacterium]
NARIEGPDAADFAIVQQPANAMIQPTQSASWLVVLQAHSVGPKQASFVVDYDGGTATVALAGEGLGDTGSGSGGAGGEKSYYTCAVGGSGAAWPFAAALLVVIRRRRRRSSAA